MSSTEGAAAYTRRTGNYPPRWTIGRCQRQDMTLAEHREVAGRGVDAADRRRARRYLAAWGTTNDRE